MFLKRGWSLGQSPWPKRRSENIADSRVSTHTLLTESSACNSVECFNTHNTMYHRICRGTFVSLNAWINSSWKTEDTTEKLLIAM